MKRTETAIFMASVGVVVLPTVFLVKFRLVEALICFLILIAAFFYAPNFKTYRQKTKKFAPFIIKTNVLGVLLSLAIYLKPSWDMGSAFIWMVIFAFMALPVARAVEANPEQDTRP